ncbi:chemotaxis protein CheA [Mesobacterium pallidum]|uniref:chemotaxis protein CheA n=1 Tax=Mesobacterium pallidum TaxID=2872037 RepID=UPI001EE22075|nr:chemotaxis protein CheA [Mesobacterium pallidum]
MANGNDLLDTFYQECEDLLVAMDEGLRELSEGESDPETINAIFRAVHSIKGGAGAFDLTELVRFSHRFETLLDELRAGRMTAEEDLIEVLQFSGDHLGDLVTAARNGEESDTEATERNLGLINKFLGPEKSSDEEVEIEFEPVSFDFDLGLATGGAGRHAITFRPTRDVYQLGHEPFRILRELAELGTLEVTLDASEVPTLDDLDPEENYLSWSILLETESSDQAIQEVFEFVDGLCTLEIRPEGDAAEGAALDTTPFDLAAGSGVSAATTVEPVPAPVEVAAAPEAPVVSEPTGSEPAPPPAAAEAAQAADARDKQGKQKAKGSNASIRVDLERVDKLVNVVGELVIHQAMLFQALENMRLSSGSELATGLDELSQLSREIQESVMAIRAQQIKPLFQRMFRIVREAGAATGKKAVLETAGEMTEVDTAVIEKLADPLTHMIRNAVDHGLEAPDKRVQIGKAETGTIRLSAAHRSGRVAITIADDGAGINRPKVKSIAIEKGLIPADADLTDAEIDNLLFLPGFSTASEVSALSGRGVGMDVVKNAIQSLGGRVTISSRPNEGTSFLVSLPLTLAVLDGMVVEVAGHPMVIPITAIVETLKPPKQDFHGLDSSDWVLSVRGTYVPVVDVGAALGFRTAKDDPTNSVVIIIEDEESSRTALLVDGIQDQRQVVIKSLEENYGHIDGVAAATVFGDGRVALILDPSSLVEQISRVGDPSNGTRIAMEERHAATA